MRVDADVAHSADDVASLSDGNVSAVHGELFGQTEVDYVYRLIFAQLAPSDDEVVRLHVAVDQIVSVYELHSI